MQQFFSCFTKKGPVDCDARRQPSRMFSLCGVLCGAALILALRSGLALSTFVRSSLRCHFLHFSSVADTCDALTLSSIPCRGKKKNVVLVAVPSLLAAVEMKLFVSVAVALTAVLSNSDHNVRLEHLAPFFAGFEHSTSRNMCVISVDIVLKLLWVQAHYPPKFPEPS